MKYKILISVIVVVIGAATIVAIASKNDKVENVENSEPEFPQMLERTAQQLFKQPESEKKAISESDVSKNQPAETNKVSLAELAGPIHNQLGIRDDILEYIERTIPPENEKAKRALIIYAAASQFIYYKATQEEAIKSFSRKFIALDCLSESLPGDGWLDVSRGVDKLMRNTPERDAYMWEIDSDYFGWKVLGNGDLSSDQVDRLCETGDY